MQIFVQVKTRAREQFIEKISDKYFRISVKSSPIDGKANQEIIELFADYFKTSKSCIEIHAGKTAPYKIINILL